MDKFYIIRSEYVQNGIKFNEKFRYVKEYDKAVKVYEKTLADMKYDNSDMLEDKSNYKVSNYNGKKNKHFCCYYKHKPAVSNFVVEFWDENLE